MRLNVFNLKNAKFFNHIICISFYIVFQYSDKVLGLLNLEYKVIYMRKSILKSAISKLIKKYKRVFKHVISFMTNYVLFFIFYGMISIPFVVIVEGEKKEVYEFMLDMSSDKPNTTDLENVKRIYVIHLKFCLIKLKIYNIIR